MDKNRDIQPIGPIANILRVKPLGKVTVFKRPEYLPNHKRKREMGKQDKEAETPGDERVNHAHESAEGVGSRVDFKV
ncbi:hypothetical protein SDC9_203942 [bioreactor metagenome]|jgi:hypothetical protein|uniref:Uncharacterized protein n=1 Tax=bioreactor metagenome TaxID=1076179 RepID=A0A645IYI6_9ZZZZ